MKKDKKYLAMRNKSVVKANDLIQKSRFQLSLQQQKIVLFLISQISADDESFKLYDFNIRDFCAVCGIDYDNGNNYAELKEQIQEIRNKSIWVTLPDGRETTLSWIEKPYISQKSGTVQIRLDSDMKPYLLQLRENFTRYELIYTLYFKSKYSIRLYELIKSIHFHDLEKYERVYNLEELKIILGAETYKTYQHFREKVLDVATREINEYSDKIVTYTPLRTGRAYDKIKLSIQTKNTDDVMRIRAEIDRKMNYNTDQLSLFDVDQVDN